MPSDVNAVDELDLPDLASAPEHDRARRRGSKGEQTRRAIAEAALRLFREQGYEATTMRAIAKEAGVATGNAYYYFGSKQELIHEYYARNHAEHAAACRAVLDAETRLDRRIAGVLRALIEVQAPYHGFAAKLYKHAAEPASPLSPFSPASSPTRGRRHLAVRRGDRGLAYPGAGRVAEPAAGTALAVLDGDRALLGARRLARVREDLPAH
jgi:AcrR family transcriptional regulator